MPRILRTKCPRTRDGKHIRDDVPQKKNGTYGVIPKCGACGKKLGKWRAL